MINPDHIKRQAVVIIHGMGEQRPNATIRGFVNCLAHEMGKEPGALPPKIFEKPDKVSGTYETRSKTILMDAGVGRPTTHIFEFYWAHHMRNTTWSEILNWMKGLLFRNPSEVPKRIRKVFWWIWGLIGVTAVVVVLVSVYHNKLAALAGVAWLVFLVRAIAGLVGSAIVNSLGDAARYMSDSPANIGQRQVIRKEGIELLRHLHEATDEVGEPMYDRVVLVSHSLGTVVAYDLLRLLWVEYSETFDPALPPFENTVLTEMEKAGYRPTDYCADVHDCWKMQRRAGNRWLVTDLVTMGSPLAYFDYLIVGSKEAFERRKADREYPTCPPVHDSHFHLHWGVPRGEGIDVEKMDKINLLSYSSLFACTRWTNLFFETDFIGGPLKPVLGAGITDVPIARKVRFRGLPYPYGHTEYWDDNLAECAGFDAVAAALRLNYNVIK